MAETPYTPFNESLYEPAPQIIPIGGVAPDLPMDQIGEQYLNSAKNFVVRNSRVRKREGEQTTLFSTDVQSAACAAFEFTLYNNSTILLLATPAKFYYVPATANTVVVDITTTARTGNYVNPVFFTPMRTATSGLRVTSVNGLDPPTWWSGDTNSAFTVFTTAVIGTCAVVWRSHLLQGNTTDSADGKVAPRVHWSALGDPTVWSGTASAGSLDLIDANASRVINFVPFRTILAAYKEEGVHALYYKASPFYFTQQLLHANIASLAPRTVASIDGGAYHFVMTKEGAVLWDGQTIKPIGKNRVDRTILGGMQAWTPTWLDHSWAYWWPEKREILLGLTTTQEARVHVVWIYNLDYDSWWETDLKCTFVYAARKLWNGGPKLLSSRDINVAHVFDIFRGFNDSTASTGIACSLQTGLLNYGSQKEKGIIRAAFAMNPAGNNATPTETIASQAAVLVYKLGTENPNIIVTSASYGSSQTITVTGAASLPVIDFRLTDRWISYRLENSAVNETFSVASIITDITERTNVRKRR